MRYLLLFILIITTLSCNQVRKEDKAAIVNSDTVKLDQAVPVTDSSWRTQNVITEFPIEGKVKGSGETPLDPDTLVCRIGGEEFMIIPEGVLSWGRNHETTLKLKTDVGVYVEKAFFYKRDNILFVFYTETDFEGATSRVEKVDLAKRKSVWQTDIYAFNLGLPYIRNNFVYLTTIGVVGKLNLQNGKYAYQFKDLYDPKNYAYNSFDTIIFQDTVTLFLSKHSKSDPFDSVLVNEKTKTITIKTFMVSR
jgi:hypothetical protein